MASLKGFCTLKKMSYMRLFLPILMVQTKEEEVFFCLFYFFYVSPYNLRPLGFIHGVFLQGMGLICGVFVKVWV